MSLIRDCVLDIMTDIRKHKRYKQPIGTVRAKDGCVQYYDNAGGGFASCCEVKLPMKSPTDELMDNTIAFCVYDDGRVIIEISVNTADVDDVVKDLNFYEVLSIIKSLVSCSLNEQDELPEQPLLF